MQSHTDEMGDTGVMDNLLEALQSGKLFEAGTNVNGSVHHVISGGRNRRPPRKDLMDFRRTMNKHSPRIALQQVQQC